VSERLLPKRAERGALRLAALLESSLAGPRFGRIDHKRQDFLTAVPELFNRENHSFLLDGSDPHSADRLANSHLVLVFRRNVPQNRNRVLASRIERHGNQLQVVQERTQIRRREQRDEWIATSVASVLKDFPVD
jgi:hypothetical protein